MSILDLFHPGVLIPWLLGMMFGVFVGATPGLTATMAVALIVPLSYKLDAQAGLALIIGVSFTAIFAGDIPATFLRIPGTPASAAATLDGHALARRGKGGLALTIDLLCSCLGGIIGVGLLMTIAPQLARFALLFSDFEYFWLAVLGLSISALVSQGSVFKGLLAAALGMLLATIGSDMYNVQRYTFGLLDLQERLNFIPVMIGLFGISEVLRNLRRPQPLATDDAQTRGSASFVAAIGEIWRNKWTALQSSVVGTFIGALPGAGADIAAWGAYGLAQKTSRRGDKFGEGEVQGVIAPTSANNAAVAGAWIPALVFGLPGDAVTAIVLGALMVYNIKPGPLLFQNSGEQVWMIFWIALITQFLLLPAGYAGIKTFGWILRLPRSVVLTAVVLFSIVGSYSLNNSVFDIWVMFAFGLIGYFLEWQRVPLAPLILGLILGPMIEIHFRTGLIKTGGDLSPFFTRPLCAALLALMILALLAAPLSKLVRRALRRNANNA